MLTRPPWVQGPSDRERRQLRYIWDDTRTLRDVTGDAAPVLGASMKMSLRARMVLCMGLYEWIVWRFEGLHWRPEPLQIAEVGWCATVDPRYMRFFELTREDWQGPVEGPLWCTGMWLQPAMSQGHAFPRGVYDAVSLLTRMGLHVLPNVEQFREWLGVTVDRLIQLHPLTLDNPLDDLFDRHVSERLGPLIGRDILDPAVEPDAEQALSFLAQNLREARDTENPFLASPADLRDVGFSDAPYVIPGR
ncbi:MAG: hypothetical protein DME01_00775 [Candidatus Rokuibacteriota bacterium]|nr:MAG: hypothetical protein DME01_00775 [Candidatus Rokubacteria bacterium]